jgi:hypothetical protein
MPGLFIVAYIYARNCFAFVPHLQPQVHVAALLSQSPERQQPHAWQQSSQPGTPSTYDTHHQSSRCTSQLRPD